LYQVDVPQFAFPARFAEISGLSAKEVRRLCQQHIIPNERTRKGFRIDVLAAIEVLHTRAADFVGHKPLQPPIITIRSSAGKKSQNGAGFLAALDELKGNVHHG